TSGRRMFVTEMGFIGLWPELTKVEDKVAILLGGSTPFMLREEPSEFGPSIYRLLGDCYVHGVMDGELVEGEKTED
ncbi:hypothetical protein EK21DRAFT_53849, partial [Setomelanomma holmii]